MSHQPGYPRPDSLAHNPAPPANISSLQNFRQEDVVLALMTQLREKKLQLAIVSKQRQVSLEHQLITEQNNLQLKNTIDLHDKIVAEKDTQITLIKQQFAHQKKDHESSLAEANLKHSTETNAETQGILQERDDELNQLKYEKKENLQNTEKLEKEVMKTKEEVATAEDKNIASISTIEQLEQDVKGKQWMLESLQKENQEQRSRETHLLASVKKLEDGIEKYETKFKGKGVDVPMLLAKLKDYEARSKDLQGQIRRLTNKKLNELVVRTVPPTITEESNGLSSPPRSPPPLSPRSILKPEEIGGENQSEATGNSSYMDDDATYGTNAMDEMVDLSPTKSSQDGVLGDFLSDVKVGIEVLDIRSLFCSHRPSSVYMGSPLSCGSPRSPQSRTDSSTFSP